MKNRTLLLAAAFMLAITPMVAGTSAMTKQSSIYSDSKDYFGVSGQEIYDYMLGYGLHVQSLTPIGETGDVYATTLEKKSVLIHIQEGAIIGWSDPDA